MSLDFDTSSLLITFVPCTSWKQVLANPGHKDLWGEVIVQVVSGLGWAAYVAEMSGYTFPRGRAVRSCCLAHKL